MEIKSSVLKISNQLPPILSRPSCQSTKHSLKFNNNNPSSFTNCRYNFLERTKEEIKKISNRYTNKSQSPKYIKTLSSAERYRNFIRTYKLNNSKENLFKNWNTKTKEDNLKENLLISEEIIQEEKVTCNKFHYYKIIENGNDSFVIKNCLENRINWVNFDKHNQTNNLCFSSNNIMEENQRNELIDSVNSKEFEKNENNNEINKIEDKDINFIWAPASRQINFKKLAYGRYTTEVKRMCNHLEFHYEISNKLKMFKNMMNYCEETGLNLFDYLPFTILMEYSNNGFMTQFKSFCFMFKNMPDFIFDNNENKQFKRKYRAYFYVDKEKDQRLGLKTYLFVPKTHYDGKNLWLLKAINLNRGMGIKIINSLDQCENYIRLFYQGNINKCVKDLESSKTEENLDSNKKIYYELPQIVVQKKKNEDKYNAFKNGHDFCLYRQIDYNKLIKSKKKQNEGKKKYQSNKILLQKYIEKPLLYKGRKFDMRYWVLITDELKVYVFKEGHLKAASFLFDISNLDSFIHLTNYSVQKYSKEFSKFEKGNEISVKELKESLKNNCSVDIEHTNIFKKICNIIWLSLKSVKKLINSNERKGCFEIFGYDFMLDVELNPFLIEINTNPGLEISSPLIEKLVPRMIDDALRLTLDKVFVPTFKNGLVVNGKYVSPFKVEGYSDEEIMYEYLGDLKDKKMKN